MSQLGKEVKRLRTAAGVGVRELGRRALLSPTFICMLERGKSPALPGEDAMFRLASSLGADWISLMCLAGKLPADVVEYLTEDPERVRAIRSEMARETWERDRSPTNHKAVLEKMRELHGDAAMNGSARSMRRRGT